MRKVFKILSLGGSYFHNIMMLIKLPWWSVNPWGIAYLYQEGFIVNLLSLAHWEWYHLELSLRDTTAPSQNLSLFWLYLFNLLTAVWATPSLTTASSTFSQLLTYSTHQELCQNAAEFPLTVPLTFLVSVLTLALWPGLGIPDPFLKCPAQESRVQKAGSSRYLLTDCLTGPYYW